MEVSCGDIAAGARFPSAFKVSSGDEEVKVWDLPTRLFHWLIVLVFCVSWYTAEQGMMIWHYRSGILGLALLMFRIIWGFVGGSTARFSNFVRTPAAVIRYLSGSGEKPLTAGHNPLGGYSAILLLVVLCVQVGTGLFAVDVDGLESGPLSFFVSFDQGRLAAEVHEIAFTALQVLIALHVLAIIFYRLRGNHLTKAMITGNGSGSEGFESGLQPAGTVRLIVVVAIAVAFAWWVNSGAIGI